jgi:hypothetical protein
MCLDRTRSIPSQVLYLLPLVPAVLATAPVPGWSLGLASLPGWWMVRGIVAFMLPLYGFGVHAHLYPQGSVAFVERTQPRPNIFHTTTMGAYLVWHLRDYRLYSDTRDTMYWHLQPEMVASFRSAEVTGALLKKYDVHTALMPIPATRYLPGVGFEDVIAAYLPPDRWALVYFDNVAFVKVARIPEHAALIADHAYTLLRPNLPPNAYALSKGRTPERDATFAREVTRCLHDEPDNVYCQIAQASFWRVTDPERLRGGTVLAAPEARP